MNVRTICSYIEEVAPLALQESYDNAGLLVGDMQMEVKSILITLDVTEAVVKEAIEKKCNLIISHHPLIFAGLKRLVGKNEVQRCVTLAIKNDIAIYAAHTNLDNVSNGVNAKIAQKLGLVNLQILQPKQHGLLKLVTFVPQLHSYAVREALFQAGCGVIGNYDACSFSVEGNGTFKANNQAHPFVGDLNKMHTEQEVRLEMILPKYLQNTAIHALITSHPYEEPAYDFIALENEWKQVGAGMIGELPTDVDEKDFLLQLKSVFNCQCIKHTALQSKKIKRVAFCGGSGSSFLKDAIAANADIFISGDFKYHDFFDAENRIIIADIGHYESEQFTKEIFLDIITKKMPTFAVQISDINTNPINYL